MSATTELVTADQLFSMPSDNFRYELRKGVLTKMSPSGFEHGAIVATLTARLFQFVDECHLGVICGAETGFRLSTDPDTVLAPDVSFIKQSVIERVGRTPKFWPGPPDLAVEVMSPEDSVRKATAKANEWLNAGTSLVWLVNPLQRRVIVFDSAEGSYELAEHDCLLGGNLLPGFRLNVSEIFA